MTDKLTTSTPTSLRVWLRLLTCTRLIENHVRAQLRASFNTTLPRFDVMSQLYRYPDGLRMGEISQLLLVTNGNITGIIDQLESEKLVERTPDSADRRAFQVRLTASGIAAFEAMAEQHRGWIVDLLVGMSDDDQQELQDLLTKLRDTLQKK